MSETRPDRVEIPPQAVLLRLLLGYVLGRGLHAVVELGLADHLGSDPQSAQEVAREVSSDPEAVERLLRSLASVGVFAEATPGRFALTPVGELLRTDSSQSMRGLARLYSVGFMREAVNGLPRTIRTGASAFEHAHGMPLFTYLAQHAGDAALFDAAMTSASATEIPAILAAYDFSGVDSVVDVGGGRGALLKAVLVAHPKMRGVLFERPEVVIDIGGVFAVDAIADRAEAIGGDFFQSVPRDAGAYVLKSVIHDWGDAQAIDILTRCRDAMGPDARILVMDPLVPPGDQPSPNSLLDLLLLAVTGSGGGRERTEADYRQLFEAARLRLERVIPTRSRIAILEGFPAA